MFFCGVDMDLALSEMLPAKQDNGGQKMVPKDAPAIWCIVGLLTFLKVVLTIVGFFPVYHIVITHYCQYWHQLPATET